MHLNYQDLCQAYKANLATNLRGFKGGEGFLANWTMDEDPQRSILNVIDLAREEGEEVLSIHVLDEVLPHIFPRTFEDGSKLTLVGNTVFFESYQALVVKVALNTVARELGRTEEIDIVKLRKHIVTIDYKDTDAKDALHHYLMKIEKELANLLGRYLYIETLNIDDKNKRDKKRCQ